MPNTGSRIKIHVDSDLKELIPGFLKNRQHDITKLNESLDLRDFVIISRLGHSMKGNGSSYGFDKISELGKLIEIAANQQQLAEIKSLVAELADFLDRVDIEYV